MRRTDHGNRVVRSEYFQTVRRQHRHDLASLHAGALQCAGKALHERGEHTPTHGARSVDHRRLVRVRERCTPEKLYGRQGHVVRVPGRKEFVQLHRGLLHSGANRAKRLPSGGTAP